MHTVRISDPFAKEQLAKNRAGQFDWVLTLPIASVGSPQRNKGRSNSDASADAIDGSQVRKLFFGCNFLHRRTRSGSDVATGDSSADSYTLIATPIEADEDLLACSSADDEGDTMAPTANDNALAAPSSAQEPEQSRLSPKALFNGNEGSVPGQHTPRSPAIPVMRIEDSFEELDRLEEEFEAVDNIVQVERVPSPDKVATGGENTDRPRLGKARSSSAATMRSVSVRGKATELLRTGSLRKAASQARLQDEDRPAPKPSPKKMPVPRPASLLPPKPPARSSKPPTMPTFELPGEAVARRLKEQREARMSGIALGETPRPASPPPRIRSTKVPTRPTFELPGEAISRRKREEREAKLRAQEEEERKRREFKARPIRTSIAPNSYPRETIASRARQSKAAAGENGDVATTPVSASSKRYSIVPLARAALSVASNLQPRGRESTVGSPSTTQASRAASSSTGSVSGKRSTVSAEDVAQQKVRGKEIYSRDNSITVDRDRERREREGAAKMARLGAAERSRVLSREWAEKQKQRLKKLATGSAANAAVR